MRDDIQAEVEELWNKVTTENLDQLGDLEGYRKEFYKLFGFDVEGVDYTKEANEMTQIESIK